MKAIRFLELLETAIKLEDHPEFSMLLSGDVHNYGHGADQVFTIVMGDKAYIFRVTVSEVRQ